MTNGALHVSVLALGVAALAWLTPLSPALADSPAANNAKPSLAEPAPTPVTAPNGSAPSASAPVSPAPAQSAAAPSVSEPAPTPSVAESGTGATHQRPSHAYKRHYARAYVHRYREEENPVMAAAHGVVGGVTTLGSVAAYPIYCFPNYGSCPLRRLYP